MKKKIAFLLLAIFLVSGCGASRKNVPEKEYVKELKELGYNDKNIKVIESKLTEEDINILKEYKYIENIEILLKDSSFDSTKMKDYLDYFEITDNIYDVLLIVNNKITNKYTEKLSEIINNKYFVLSNLGRYVKYNSEDIDNVVTMVNTNRDYGFYEVLKDADLNKGFLILVNKYYGLGVNYRNENMVRIDTKYATNSSSFYDAIAYDQFKRMVDYAKTLNLDIKAKTTFMTYATQSAVLDEYRMNNGIEYAEKYAAHPGHSEHQTGLALDVAVPLEENQVFTETEEYKWLSENAYKYGFIERYTSDKEYITGYAAEPWHFRYVGVDAAITMHDENLCLEEYYAYYVENNKN